MKLIEALRAYTKIVQAKLDATIFHSHNPTKGEAREEVIREGFLCQFLPHCYVVRLGLVFSADGDGSRQVDIVIYDPVYSIILCANDDRFLFPCESVFASVEVKSSLNSNGLKQAVENIKSLKDLKRESSDSLDFTPVARLKVDETLAYGKTKMNPYFGIVLALDGMNSKNILDQLVRSNLEHRDSLSRGNCASSTIKQMYHEGIGTNAIARFLNTMKIPTKQQGKGWHKNTIAKILKREGVYVERRRVAKISA